MKTLTLERIAAGLKDNILIINGKTQPNINDQSVLYAAVSEMMLAGFLVSPEDLDYFSMPELDLVVRAAQEISGSTRRYASLFPDFPQGVKRSSMTDLIVHQIIHYLSNGTWGVLDHDAPRHDGESVEVMLHNASPLEVMDVEHYADRVVTKALSSHRALSVPETEDLAELVPVWLMRHDNPWSTLATASHRENAMAVMGVALDTLRDRQDGMLHNNDEVRDAVVAMLSAAQHSDMILRIILLAYALPEDRLLSKSGDTHVKFDNAVTHLSDRDANAIKFRPIPRSVRKSIIRAAVRSVRHGGQFRFDRIVSRNRLWTKVFRTIHAGEFTKKSIEVAELVDVVYGNSDYVTLSSAVEQAIASKDAQRAVLLLADNNSYGNLVRRSIAIMRIAQTKKDGIVLARAIAAGGDKVSLSTLISAYNGVVANGAGEEVTTTVGGHANITREVKALPEARRVLLLQALVKAIKNQLATVDRDILPDSIGVNSDIPLSLMERESSSSVHTIERGAKIALPEQGDTVRLFTHWFNIDNNEHCGAHYDELRVDLDLGVTLYDENLTESKVITWNSYHGSAEHLSVYSGDITNSNLTDGVAEFIDVDIERALRSGYRYAVHSIYNYTGQLLSEVTHSSGAMIRTGLGERGDKFDARTVATSFRSTADARAVAGFAIDLQKRELIWLDINSGKGVFASSSATGGALHSRIREALLVPKFTKGDLMLILAQAHGIPVTEEAVDDNLVEEIMKNS